MSQGQKKQFVKFTNFDDNYRHTPKHRDSKTYVKKNYQEKNPSKQQKKPQPKQQVRQQNTPNAFTMLDSFALIKITPKVQQLVKLFPKFFSNQNHKPQKERPQILNQFVIIVNSRKPHSEAPTAGNGNNTNNSKPMQLLAQESDPQWDTGSQQDFKLESKQIDNELKKKAQQKFVDLKSKTKGQLKRHEKQFLQDHFKNKKKLQQQGQLQSDFRVDPSNQIIKKKQSSKEQLKKQQIKQPVNIITDQKQESLKVEGQSKGNFFQNWLNIDNKSQAGSAGCWIQKIQNDDENFGDLQVAEDDDIMFDLDDQDHKQKDTSSDEDDAFVDEESTTIHTKKNNQSEKEKKVSNQSEKHGTVVINTYTFSNIAQKVGIPPASCIWVISDKNDRYKVSTEYMDRFYRQQNIYHHYPYISLNHSDFVHNSDVGTEKGFEKFKRLNERKLRAQKYKPGQDKKPNNYNHQKKQYQPHIHKKR